MVRIFLVSFYIFSGISCSFQHQDVGNELMINWVINNKILKEQILAYIDSVETPNIADKVIMITHKSIEDTSIYTLGYCINISTLQYFPPSLFFKVDENFGFLLMENNVDFSLTEEALITIMKSYFPDQYDYYMKYGDYPPPITAREVLWRLTLKEDELVKKEELRN
ncbi:MAG: hypothetical protein K9H49_19010 [Bacteroidales bacterium]|nr:hypothetical protein [Bacteroidales bacterium]